MPLAESLTIRILGDSSALRRELDQVAERLTTLQDRLSRTSQAGRRIGESLGSIASALRQVGQLSQMLSQITQQVQALSHTPVSLNVQPALNGLRQLMAAVQATAATLQSAVGAASTFFPQIPRVPEPAAGPRRMASGGLVTGPPGIDRVPAMLSAGEFVLSRTAVQNWGTSFLDSLNSLSRRPLAPAPFLPQLSPPQMPADPWRQSAATPAGPPQSPSPASPASANTAGQLQPRQGPSGQAVQETHTTNNHFGGITIQVRETADVGALVRDLRLQRIQLRNRRG